MHKIGTIGIDTWHHHDIDILEHFFAISAAQLGHIRHSALSRRGFVAVGLCADKNDGLAVLVAIGPQQLSSLLEHQPFRKRCIGKHR